MDWLRSEDLKEEKKVTASVVIIAVEVLLLGEINVYTHGPSMSMMAILRRLRKVK